MTPRSGFAALFVLALTGCGSAATDDQVASSPPGFDEAFTVGLTEDRQSALLRFEPDSELAQSRGVSWRLEEWSGSSWESRWILAGEAFTVEEWNEGDYAVGSVEVMGVGPDVLPMPAVSTGEYRRICHGFDDSDAEGCGTVPLEPTDPNSAATTVQPTTTVPNDE